MGGAMGGTLYLLAWVAGYAVCISPVFARRVTSDLSRWTPDDEHTIGTPGTLLLPVLLLPSTRCTAGNRRV